MIEGIFKILGAIGLVIVLIIVIVSFKAGEFFGSMDNKFSVEMEQTTQQPLDNSSEGITYTAIQTTDNGREHREKQQKNYYSDVKITTIDFDVVGNNGEPGIKVWSNVVLPSGHHNYRINYFFYDENGRPIKDENGLYNIEEYVGGMGHLGEQDIPENQSRKLTYGFYLPYDELHLKKFGHIQLYVAARLVQDENNTLAETPAFGFVVIHSV